MENMTAEQAIEAAKGVTFEKLWASLVKNSQQIEQMRESQRESQRETRELKTRMDESWQNINKTIDELSKNIGGLNNSFARFMETMFSTELWKKFNELGYSFTRQYSHAKFHENGQTVAEVDLVVENGEYVMLVEIKTTMSKDDVDDHLERIGKIRSYMDARRDDRKLLGAVAGGTIPEGMSTYAQKKGLFVIVQSGDSVAIATAPKGFKAREW